MAETNWAGNYIYRARELHQPTTLDELRRIVARASSLRVLGTRHAFNDIGDADELVSIRGVRSEVELDADAMTVTVPAGMAYGELARVLIAKGYALHAMASLPHISIGGAIQTATHGSGDRTGCLSTAVRALEMVTSEGDVVQFAQGDADFEGMVVGLGALGVVTRVTLAIEPMYEISQWVFRHLPWQELFENLGEITSAAESVSLFTDYGDDVDQVWLKRRLDGDWPAAPGESFYRAVAADRDMHPVASETAERCTPQMGVPGAWADRLPHFRLDATPSSGAEIQSEYILPRQHAVAAIEAMRGLAPRMQAHLLVSEIRTIAADDLWLSMAYEQESVGFHLTWKRDPDAVAALLPEIERALAPFDPRPHWSKTFAMSSMEIAQRYQRFNAFAELRDRMDYRGAFRNAYTDRILYA